MRVVKYSLKDYADKYTEVWGAYSESHSEREPYTVALNKKGQWSCGCPRWTRNASRPECKHIRFIKAFRVEGFAASKIETTEPTEKVRRQLTTFSMIELE